MKNLIIILLTLVITYGCNKDESNETEITPILIGKAELFGNGEEGIVQSNLVISQTEDWNALIEQMDSVNNTSNSFTEIDIDFSQFQVIAVFDEIRGSGGSSINITKIIENKDDITVFISSYSNNDLPAVDQPFHIVKIKKTEKPFIFLGNN